jgi:hypothetical protein
LVLNNAIQLHYVRFRRIPGVVPAAIVKPHFFAICSWLELAREAKTRCGQGLLGRASSDDSIC